MNDDNKPSQSRSLIAGWHDYFVRLLHLDKPILFTILNQIFNGLSIPLSLYLVGVKFSAEEQGYYFTFASIVALQVIFELGFNQCLIQFASHEFALLQFDSERGLVGDELARDRLISLARLALKWYAAVGILLLVCIGLAGHIFFASQPHKGVNWIGPWWALCAAAAIFITVQPLIWFLEGCNQVGWTALTKAAASGCRGVGLCLAIWCGMGLYAAALATFLFSAVCAIRFLVCWRKLLRQFLTIVPAVRIDWFGEIWPFQWKIAVSWVSGFLIFQLFNPVLFHYAGPAAAGRFGATWTVMQGITAIAGTWGVTKIARYGMLIKKHQFRELDQLWQQSTWRSAIVAALGVIAVLTILFVFKNNRVIQTRFLGWLDTLFLGLATVLNVIVLNQAIYLRAHKREPFVIPSCVGGVVIIVTLLILAPLFGERGATLSYLMPSLVLLPLPTLIFLNCRKKWHAES